MKFITSNYTFNGKWLHSVNRNDSNSLDLFSQQPACLSFKLIS